MIVSAKMIQEQVKCEGEDKKAGLLEYGVFIQALVKEVLDNGDYVIATARKPEVLVFEKATSTNFIAAV
jgi:hypothetical protein